MTPTQIEAVQSSWASVEPIASTAADLFYDRLFEIAPEARALFKGDLSEQKVKLMRMLGMVVKSLHQIDTLIPAIQSLGRRHVDYGVKAEHYPIVGEALLWTLEQGLGDAFTPEVKAAWTEAYTTLAGVMKSAAYGGG